MEAGLAGLEQTLGYRFQHPELLERALTHTSRANERGDPPGTADNEQFEFLGDSILGFVVSDKLLATFPTAPEGRLSKIKAQLVSASHLHEVAQSLSLGDYLLLGRGEELSGGRTKKALLADAVEALLAAIYLDGGIDAARLFVAEHILESYDEGKDGHENVTDYKSALQEMAQALKLPLPRYNTLHAHGPEHAKTFVVEVSVGRDWVSQAEGLSKKTAGQHAARLLLEQLSEWGR